jgi:hypothetical protein
MKEAQPMKRSASQDIGQHQLEYNFQAANARRNAEKTKKLDEAENMAGVQGMQLQHSKQLKDAAEEQQRQNAATIQNLTHHVSVLQGHIARGRSQGASAASERATSAASTRLYGTVRHHAAAPTVHYPAHGATTDRSRSPLLPIDDGEEGDRSMSTSVTRHKGYGKTPAPKKRPAAKKKQQ